MISPAASTVCANRILSALSQFEFQELSIHLEPVEFKRGEMIYEPDEPIKYVYFPESCIFSQLTVFSDGSSVESGIVGREGLAGMSIVLSPISPTRETFVQTQGRGFRIETDKFRRALENNSFRDLVFQFGSVYFEQVAQAGACSNHHPANQRLARLLLMIHDRIDGDSFYVTQESLAQMLGIYRPSVTIAAVELKDKNLIKYSRGVITIKNRAGLEAEACECYSLISRIYNNYLELIEQRRLSRKMEQMRIELEAEMHRRRELRDASMQRIEQFQQAVIEAQSPLNAYSICSSCHYIRDKKGNWQNLVDFLERHLQTIFHQRLCPTCLRND